MSDMDKKPKKRGRKPKNKVVEISATKTEIKSEEEPLIAHLPINIKDIIGESNKNQEDSIYENDNVESSAVEEDSLTNYSESDSIFLKPDVLKKPVNINFNSSENKNIESIENEISRLNLELHKLTRNNKIEISKTNYDQNTKCWWCKNCFTCPSVGIPELYFEDKFYCIGNFCSYNCALAYNIDVGDNVWKRTSLLNLLYYKTYENYSNIKAAPDWKVLKEFGGNLTIEQFRKNSIINNSDYTMLHPPLETRVNTFEKNYKVSSKSSNSMYQHLLEESDELVLKRSKPLKSSQYSLDKTIIKKKERTIKMNKLTNLISSISA